MPALEPTPTSRANIAALLFAMTYPTLLTWIYFTLLKDSPGTYQQAAFGVGKVIQFGFPAFWVFCVLRRPLTIPRPISRGLSVALIVGVLQLVAGLAVYQFWLKPSGLFAAPMQEMLAKLRGFGLDSRVGFVILAVGYSVIHSWLEEYYWRWFVFNELRPSIERAADSTSSEFTPATIRAIIISSLAFAAHHVLVLAGYFRWDSPWTYILSACVAAGGAIFAWLYVRSRSLYAPWLAHACADAVIFLIGFDLLGGQLK
ncbi:CPBP family intramembrane glutamic endopeptidase [Anatilimnocola sp. NA78]|uniref:CPBP family intramembrane glutamic endopeptidase n=1 Tax=Anatilimnocola sp. NA78 TaxID=3415683 RepID=UPI003CE4707C